MAPESFTPVAQKLDGIVSPNQFMVIDWNDRKKVFAETRLSLLRWKRVNPASVYLKSFIGSFGVPTPHFGK
jgi:hypothetical protein